MFQRFHEMREREGGFTLIELLVVILIVAILAAVAIPVFLRQREKGYVDQAQSSLKNAATAMESWATENNGDYTGPATGADLANGGSHDQGFSETTDVTITVVGTTTDYCITAVHANLDASHDWATATYNSENGEPLAADTCA
ncbi:MAG: type IV pilin protein [Actinomycetota bacterium]